MRTPSSFRIAKHQNRFRRVAAKNAGSYRLSVDCLTKEVLSSDGPPDTSQSRLSPLALHHAGGVGNAPVQFALEVILVARTICCGYPFSQLTTKPPLKQT